MTDLELVLTHLGWTGCHDTIMGIMGYPPGSPTQLSKAPRYDQSIDLMVELVGTLDRDQTIDWYWALAEANDLEVQDIPQAKAALRLRAYCKVKGL